MPSSWIRPHRNARSGGSPARFASERAATAVAIEWSSSSRRIGDSPSRSTARNRSAALVSASVRMVAMPSSTQASGSVSILRP